MPVKKQQLKSKQICKATFKMAKPAAPDAKAVFLVGEFNNWDTKATPMKKLKDGSFTVTIDLESGREYQYRYLIDGITWENDWEADKYVPNPTGSSDNSVVVT